MQLLNSKIVGIGFEEICLNEAVVLVSVDKLVCVGYYAFF